MKKILINPFVIINISFLIILISILIIGVGINLVNYIVKKDYFIVAQEQYKKSENFKEKKFVIRAHNGLSAWYKGIKYLDELSEEERINWVIYDIKLIK